MNFDLQTYPRSGQRCLHAWQVKTVLRIGPVPSNMNNQ